jgi:peroxiredoxin
VIWRFALLGLIEEKVQMALREELADFQAEFERTAPAGRVALYEEKIEELRRSFPLHRAPAVGDIAVDFTLPDAKGMRVALFDVLRHGPAVVTFYRGNWCPYCNLQLRAYQRALSEIEKVGARLVAISPQRPDKSLLTAESNALEFDVLSDVGNTVARSYGLVYAVPQEIRDVLRSVGKALPDFNDDDSWELPLPATFVIAPDRTVMFSFIEIDYRKRLAPEEIISSLITFCGADQAGA